MTPARVSEIADADRRRVQRSALRVALSVAFTSVAIVVLITAFTLAVVLSGSRPDGRGGRRGEQWSDRVVDVGDVVPLILVLGLVGVLALSLVAWHVARRSTLSLAEALRVQRTFVADASHELRTPLTTLTSRIQLAQHRAARGGDVVSALDELSRDAAVMDAVLTDLLLAAEAAGNHVGGATATASVHAAAAVAANTIQVRAAAANIIISIDVPDGLNAAADMTALTRALVALIDNAVRHSPSGGTVSVSGSRVGRDVELRVSDDGDGIAGIAPERLFDRFVRTDHGPARRGFGLGLALVRDIAARFGGEVSVERTSSTGTTFLLTLPEARHPPRP